MEYYSGDSDNDLDKLVDNDDNQYDDVSGDEAIEDNSHNFEEEGVSSLAPAPKPPKVKKVILNPQPKLNFETLQSTKGLLALNELFEGHKFRGSGHEKEDMGNLLKKMEQWAYRLYPKFHFEDSLKRFEALGKKREVQVYLRKIRTGMLDNDFVRQVEDNDDDENGQEDAGADNETDNNGAKSDAFDELLSQQIAKTQGTPRHSAFDELLSQHVAKPPGTPPPGRLDEQSEPFTRYQDTPRPTLTAEQLARIERNRKMALDKILQKVNSPLPKPNMDEKDSEMETS